MAANMDALLRIATRVTGAEQVTALQKKFNQVEGAAQALTSRVGPLGGALGALAPVATVGGLAALVGKTIEAGDKFNDLSQRTGVSVESLAKFNKAAATSGTDIDAVAKSLGRLSKGLYETATTGKGPTAEALKTLGISATDAAGKLKSADQVTLEIANKFKAMPDGVEKTALAMQLFGKSGAEMVPLLNMGGTAIDSLSSKMTTAFAEKADQYSDKLAVLGGKVGGLAAGLTMALLPALELVVDGITAVVDVIGKLPGPIQTIIGLFAGLAIAVTALAPALSLLAGTGLWTTITTAFTGFLTFMSTTFVPAMLAFFSGPAGWITLAVIAVAAMVYTFREPIGKFISWMGEQLSGLAKSIGDVMGGIGKTIYGAVDAINKSIQSTIKATWDWVSSAVGNVAKSLAAPFEAAAGAIKGVLRSVLQFGAQVINGFLGAVNQMINAVNSVAARLRLPQLPTFGTVSVPSYAGGGYTGNAPRSGGIDGQGGFMAMLHPRETVIDHARTGAGGGVPNITIKTGEVLQMPDGSQWVSMADLEQAMRATAAGVLGQLRTPAGRIAMGGA
jgi:phage-related protein